MASNDRAPLTKKDRRDALLLAARLELGERLVTHEKARLSSLLMRYENALQSVGYRGTVEKA